MIHRTPHQSKTMKLEALIMWWNCVPSIHYYTQSSHSATFSTTFHLMYTIRSTSVTTPVYDPNYTVDPHLSGHKRTKQCLDNWNDWMYDKWTYSTVHVLYLYNVYEPMDVHVITMIRMRKLIWVQDTIWSHVNRLYYV